MIGYVTVGANDRPRMLAFYDALFAELGAARVLDHAEPNPFTLWMSGGGGAGFAVAEPFDGRPASAGNGVMTAFSVDARAKVDAVHARALELGASDEGAPGLRGPEGPGAFYGAYFRDPEGNKVAVYRLGGI